MASWRVRVWSGSEQTVLDGGHRRRRELIPDRRADPACRSPEGVRGREPRLLADPRKLRTSDPTGQPPQALRSTCRSTIESSHARMAIQLLLLTPAAVDHVVEARHGDATP